MKCTVISEQSLNERHAIWPGGQSASQEKGAEDNRQRDWTVEHVMRSLWRDGWLWLLAALLIALGLRVINLGYAEFQGDEAAVLVRAARALEGNEGAIFQHNKGPAELVIVMAGWRLTGITNEWMARLPFSWAGILGVAAVFLCGRRLGRPAAGGVAACLLAIEGFLVGFGRIVQYQSLVFALGTFGLLILFVYRECRAGYLVALAAAFFAGGALAHYDAMLALPAGILLIAARLWQDRGRGARAWLPVGVGAVLGLLLLGVFYIPLLRGPYFGQTTRYLSGRVGSGAYNHLPSSFELSAVYDAVYLLALMTLALGGRLVAAWKRWGPVGMAVSVGLLGLALSGLLWPDLWVLGDRTWAWVPFAVLCLGALLSRRQSMAMRAVWVWLGVSALFYLFFVAVPLTHIHTAFPAWALLVGLTLVDVWRWLRRGARWMRPVVAVGGVLVYGVCGFYAGMMFVSHTPEYRRTFPQSKHPLYWTPYERMPQAGLFGFPYRAGWKTVGYLMDQGHLMGSYDSNEESEITDYYTRQGVRFGCASPDVYIVANNVQDEVAINQAQIEAEYQAFVVVQVNDRDKLTIYSRDDVAHPRTYRARDYGWSFDLRTVPARVAYPAPDRLEALVPQTYVSHQATLGQFAHLLGYQVDTTHAVRGGYVELTLLWQALGSAPIDYQVFTHLHNGEMMCGQLDGQPVCGNQPTSEWQVGQVIVDPYRIPIKADAPLGPVPLTVGMYDLATMTRLTVTSPDGSVVGDSVYLLDVEIQEP